MARDKKPRSRTDLIVSVVVHAIVIGGIFYWAAKTGIIPEEISRAFNIAQTKKPAPPKPKPIEPPKAIKQEVKSRTLAAVQLSDEALYRPLGILHRQGRHFTPAIERFIAELK